VFVVFDGTSRLGEAFACVGRFIDDNFSVKQRLLQFQTLRQSMTGIQIAFQVNLSLSDAGIPLRNLLGTNRNGAAVNGVAISTLESFRESSGCLTPLWNLGCLAHFLNLVGERMGHNLARSFLSQWKSMMGHSVKARYLFRETTGKSFIASSATRWWSEWDQVDQVCALYPQILEFLKSKEAPESAKLLVSCSFNLVSQHSPNTIFRCVFSLSVLDSPKPGSSSHACEITVRDLLKLALSWRETARWSSRCLSGWRP